MALTASLGDMNHGFQAGIVNGDVNPTINLPPKRRETPPQSSIVIPFARDADFVERGHLLDKLSKKCALPDARYAIVGLGGVGKSQLAIEHSYRVREQSPKTWVLWAHASNAARLEQSFRDIADRVKIVGRQDPQANIFKLVHDWLCDSKEPWLLVLDNVDDASFLLNAETASSQMAARPLREYLPHCELGSILVTSRNEQAAKKLVEQRDIITLDPMDETESLALLTRKLGAQADKSNGAELAELAELAAALEYMPLAIVQAAAYISQRAPLCSVAQYLDQFRKSERKRTSLLRREEGQLRRDREAKNSIITTWQISFEHIQQTRPSAADLLSLMSFFDRQGIPRNVLQVQGEHKEGEVNQKVDEAKAEAEADHNTKDDRVQSVYQDEDVEEYSNNDFENGSESDPSNDSVDDFKDDDYKDDDPEDDAFYEDIMALRNFCFVSVNNDGTNFEMHALVQLSMRTWLAVNGKLEYFKEQFINNLYAAFPTGEYENWVVCQALFAHAKAAASQKPEAASSLIEWATLLYRAAWYAEGKGRVGEAETLAMQSMKVRKKVLGQEHKDTVWSISMVADTYSLSGRWDEAEKLEVQVMETCKKKLGAYHPDTLTSMANLASTYWNQGLWDAAEELKVQVMETSRKKLGADHPHTLTSMANLASTYWKQGRWDAAEELDVQVMETSKKKLGADHPDTLNSIANLASTYWNQGRWDAAEELEVQVMETSMKKLGADHPHTLTSMHNLAWTWKCLERNAEAINLLQKCVRLRCQTLRAEHPNLVSSSETLAAWEAEQALSTLRIGLQATIF